MHPKLRSGKLIIPKTELVATPQSLSDQWVLSKLKAAGAPVLGSTHLRFDARFEVTMYDDPYANEIIFLWGPS